MASTCGQCWFGQGSVVGIVFESFGMDWHGCVCSVCPVGSVFFARWPEFSLVGEWSVLVGSVGWTRKCVRYSL